MIGCVLVSVCVVCDINLSLINSSLNAFLATFLCLVMVISMSEGERRGNSVNIRSSEGGGIPQMLVI